MPRTVGEELIMDGTEAAGGPAEQMKTAILDRFQAVRETPPAGIAEAAWRSSTDYAIGRYNRGLPRYRRIVERVGFTGGNSVLDLGSGAGHFSLALAERYEHVQGVEPSAPFVELARLAAKEVGADDRIEVAQGTAEDSEFAPASFTAVFTNSVLHFCNHERVLSNVSRWLTPGGRLYCAYTSIGGRLKNMLVYVEDRDRLLGQARMLLAQFLFEAGVYTTAPRIRVFMPGQMHELVRTLGFEVVDEPGVQEFPGITAGFPNSFDFAAVKRHELSELLVPLSSHKDEGDLGPLRSVLQAGAPMMVIEAVDRSATGLDGPPGARALYLQALTKAGLIRGHPLRSELAAELGGDPLLHAVYLLEHRRPRPAAGVLGDVPSSPDQEFLLGVCLHQIGSQREAAELFRQALTRNPHDVRALAGLIAAEVADERVDAAGAALTEFVELGEGSAATA